MEADASTAQKDNRALLKRDESWSGSNEHQSTLNKLTMWHRDDIKSVVLRFEEDVKAEVRRLHSPDIPDLANYSPQTEDNFCFLLQVLVGPAGTEAEESFDLLVCTTKRLAEKLESEPLIFGHAYLFVRSYDFGELQRTVKRRFEIMGASWDEIASKLGRLGEWE